MADEDDSQKTEEPTERKLSQAREKGQVSSSQEIKSWAILMGGAGAMALTFPWMMDGLAGYLVGYIENANVIIVEPGTMVSILTDSLYEMGYYLAPTFAILMVMAILSNVAQVGFLIALKKIQPELKKISLIGGVKRMFSLRSVIEFLKGIFKLSILGSVVFFMAVPWFDDVIVMPDMEIGHVLERLFAVSMSIMAGAIMVMTAVAVIDYTYQKFDFMKSMRMSHKDLKDEYKDTEGDPMIKARIRKLRMERAQQRMMSNVPDADVVITNPTHYSIALKYKMDDMRAPVLLAKGVDSLAFRIREVAKENDVPIVENAPLARALYASVELDEEIPMEHYQAVAEVIGYIMKLKGKR
ncbi:MAG: flagellar biosynthesis protein FlhB [Rhodospirillaceae bacterium]|nr:MAG: flagellar biosynthesis protein FlhB [Rhodospirillaceae bacterium]